MGWRRRRALVAFGVSATLALSTLASPVGLGASASRSGNAFKLVVLGDSFSSGEGVEPFFRDGFNDRGVQGVRDNRCHRSSRAYAEWVKRPGDAKSLYAIASGGGDPGKHGGTNKYESDANVRSAGGVSWAFWACSGAVTTNVLPFKGYGGVPQFASGESYDPKPQLDLADVADADVVALTIGGNDIGFTDVLKYCFVKDCNTTAFEQGQAKIIDDAKPDLVKVYKALAKKAPKARILVLGYPQLFPASTEEQTCFNLHQFLGEQDMLRRLGTRLNDTIKAAVALAAKAGAKISFVPVADKFAGHEVCGHKGPWINGVSATAKLTKKFTDDQSFHPNLEGQRDGYATAINDLLARETDSPRATQIVGGYDYTCALTDVGGVMCWGANDRGQLGDGTTRDHALPSYVAGLRKGIAALSAGDQHVCALTRVGGAKCWGKGLTGQLGDGRVHVSTRPVDVIGLTSGVVSVSAGGEHSCALLVDGSSRCWGESGNGQFARGFNPDVPRPVPVLAAFPRTLVDLFAGGYHTCMRTSAGSVLCVGNNGASELGYGQRNASSVTPLPVPGLERGVRLLATHFANSCAVRVNSISCWGGLGQRDPPAPLPVGGLSGTIRAIAVGGFGCALTSGGAVECWTAESMNAAAVAGLGREVTTVGVGASHACAVLQGRPKCWGYNGQGQLGDGTRTSRARPVAVVGFASSP